MEAHIQHLESSALCAFDGLHKHVRTLQHVQPVDIEVFTITFTGKTSASNLLGPGNTLLDHLAGKGGFERRPVKKKRKAALPFDNQVTLQFKGVGGFKKAVKVFHNGRIHVTGCKSPLEFEAVSRAVCKQLTVITGQEVQPLQADLVMLNVNFKIQPGINLTVLRNLMIPCMSTGELISVEYTPDKFPGLICKVQSKDKVISILVYGGGCIRMCGLKTYEQAEIPFKFITTFLDQRLDLLMTPRP